MTKPLAFNELKYDSSIQWVDSLKSLGILAVILGHIASPFGQIIFSWHMPLFFIISGFFIHLDLSIKAFVIKDFRRLMIPYFIFSALGLCVEIIKRMLLHRDELEIIPQIKGIIFNMDMNALQDHYGFVLWFLPTLFLSRLLLILVYKLYQQYFFVFIVMLCLFIISFYIDLPFAIDNAFNSVLWVFLGFVFFNYFQQSKWLYLLPIAGILILLLFGMPSLDVANKNYSEPIMVIIWALAIIYSLIFLLKNFAVLNYISPLGKYTMLLYVFHPYTNNAAYIILQKLNFNHWYITFCCSLVMLYGLILIKRKFNNKGFFKYV